MKKFKKLLAAVFASTLVLSVLPVQAAQDASGLADGTAYLNINNADWGDFDAEWTNAEITGDGSYTVSMSAAEPQNLAQFNALEVVNGEAVLGTGCVLTVDSIQINGADVDLQGPSYTCSADGGGVTTRVNIYNEWNAPDDTATAGDDNHLDQRIADGNLMDATAMLFSSDYLTAGITDLVVNFTVSGFGTQAEVAVSSNEDLNVEGPAVAHLSINNSEWGDYEAEYVDAEITGDGTYTVSMTAAEPQDLAQFNALEVEYGEILMGTSCVLTIDSIVINGEEVDLQGPSYTCSADGGGVNTRVNLYNEWNAPDDTATAGNDNHLDNRVAEGNVMDATAMLFSSDYLTGLSSIEVTFTVTNFGVSAEAGEAAGSTAAEVDLNGTYNAYLGLQTPNWTYRDAWNSANGIGSENWGQFLVNNDSGEHYGVVTDAVIAGNGTYTVSVTDFGSIFADDFAAAGQDYFNLIYINTDIPFSDSITITDVQLVIDGSTRNTDAVGYLDPDETEYIKVLIQNIWNSDRAEISYYPTPSTSLEITFTVSGFAYDNAAADDGAGDDAAAPETAPTVAPATETNTDSDSGSNTGLIIGIVVAVVVVIGVVVGVVLGKKKKAK